MSEMIERVAKAIGGLDNDRCNPCTVEKIVKCEDCLKAARTAIEAMREPTEEMLEAYDKTPDNSTHTTPYLAMIDAALK